MVEEHGSCVGWANRPTKNMNMKRVVRILETARGRAVLSYRSRTVGMVAVRFTTIGWLRVSCDPFRRFAQDSIADVL